MSMTSSVGRECQVKVVNCDSEQDHEGLGLIDSVRGHTSRICSFANLNIDKVKLIVDHCRGEERRESADVHVSVSSATESL